LARAGARVATSPSKLAQALGDRYPGDFAAALDSDGSKAARALAGYIREQRDALLVNDPLVRAANVDGVHDMRVATRRLRSTLRTFRPVLDTDRTEPLRAELKWFGGLLGAVRDADVLRHRFDRALAAERPDLVIGPVRTRIHERLSTNEHAARAALAEAMVDRRYARMLDALDDFVDAQSSGDRTHVPYPRLRKAAGKAVHRADAHVERAVAMPEREPGIALPTNAPLNRDAALHEARKAYKRARYAAETLAPVAGRPAARLAKRMKKLQDTLGAHQDSVVAAQLLRDYGMRAYTDGDNAFTYGLLYAQQVASGQDQLRHLDRDRRKAGKNAVRAWLS
jgi:CHAD domain-containing protein